MPLPAVHPIKSRLNWFFILVRIKKRRVETRNTTSNAELGPEITLLRGIKYALQILPIIPHRISKLQIASIKPRFFRDKINMLNNIKTNVIVVKIAIKKIFEDGMLPTPITLAMTMMLRTRETNTINPIRLLTRNAIP